jgi:hypothetical protein
MNEPVRFWKDLSAKTSVLSNLLLTRCWKQHRIPPTFPQDGDLPMADHGEASRDQAIFFKASLLQTSLPEYAWRTR